MWRIESARCDDATVRWSGIAASARPLTFEQVAAAWGSDRKFRAFWVAGLAALPFNAYCWECPPVSGRNRSRAFECVFVPSPSLARMPADPEAFGEHFRPGCGTVTFDNLGGDALLVAPCPLDRHGDFAHLGQFVRTAPDALQHALWQAVGEALQARLGQDPVWLSTAGHGIAWLHVRLDSRPKYYRHAAYLRI